MAETRFTVRLTPRGGADRVVGVDPGAAQGTREGVLVVRVAAPPIDDAANEALLRLIARELDVAGHAVRLEAGARARTKLVSVAIDPERVRARWPGIAIGVRGRGRAS
jgi:uncharacterized protein